MFKFKTTIQEPVIVEHRFKVGDTIAHRDFRHRAYVVVGMQYEADASPMYELSLQQAGHTFRHVDTVAFIDQRYELVQAEGEQFKLGDRVRTTYFYDPSNTGTIVKVHRDDGGHVLYDVNWGGTAIIRHHAWSLTSSPQRDRLKFTVSFDRPERAKWNNSPGPMSDEDVTRWLSQMLANSFPGGGAPAAQAADLILERVD